VEEFGEIRVADDIDGVVIYLGGDKSYNSVSFYASDFDGKEKMLSYLDEWNEMCDRNEKYELEGYEPLELGEADKITYSDTVGMLMSMMQTMLNAITYVLVAFTAISLVVSSVMIGIITYVSVVERVKEIGVLRSLGARKRDIKNLFNAETFIIGLSAGLIGVVVSYLLTFLINAILNPLTGITGLASLNPVAALVMVCVSIVLTLISGLIPASAAAKKDPVIALRTE
ncbi:MAG: ABC transporter permease, partial [Clostridiales bacterium]|nr:ABC transporter permease [Clostridiales bacterium]